MFLKSNITINFKHMTELNQVYKCVSCGEIVEIVRAGSCSPRCCDQLMVLQQANTVDASSEKHVPVITRTEDGYRVVIGAEKHPMTSEHHIEWIELLVDGAVYRQNLEVGAEPEATFCVAGEKIEARAYCNLHALWSAKS